MFKTPDEKYSELRLKNEATEKRIRKGCECSTAED